MPLITSLETHKQIFLAGVPATGKSTYGNWLEQAHAFVHVDLEESQTDPTKRIVQSLMWKEPERILKYLDTLHRDVVLNQGFPPGEQSIAYLQQLRERGIVLWWFNGERQAARHEFEKRNQQYGPHAIDIRAFDYQMDQIEKYRKPLEDLFQPNILEVLKPDLTRMCSNEIFEIMFPRNQ